jgi:hypothetical protein
MVLVCHRGDCVIHSSVSLHMALSAWNACFILCGLFFLCLQFLEAVQRIQLATFEASPMGQLVATSRANPNGIKAIQKGGKGKGGKGGKARADH